MALAEAFNTGGFDDLSVDLSMEEFPSLVPLNAAPLTSSANGSLEVGNGSDAGGQGMEHEQEHAGEPRSSVSASHNTGEGSGSQHAVQLEAPAVEEENKMQTEST